MKLNSLFVIALLALFVFNSCDSGEEIDPSFEVNYRNQDLQGKIDGLEWTYQNGSVLTAPTGNEFFHTFTILDTLGDTLTGDSLACLNLIDSIPRIIFVFNTDSALVQPGETKLFHDPLQPSLTINVKFSYYDADSVKQFVTASQGAYEILKVDTTDNFIEGRMHVKANGKNVVNGNFRIPYCVY